MLVFLGALLLVTFSAGEVTHRVAKDEEFPFQVTVRDVNNQHLCGGAIITPKWILTVSDCVRTYNNVIVGYGAAEFNNQKKINSLRIFHEINLPFPKFALIELRNNIEFSKTVSQASLPTMSATLRNSTKLNGWYINRITNDSPVLSVIDKYNLVLKECRSLTGSEVHLADDEFCGVEEKHPENILYLSNAGTVVSKSAIILGMLTKKQGVPIHPAIFSKVAEHGQWIKDVLNEDTGYISWVDEIPKDSAFQSLASFTLLGFCVIFQFVYNAN